jgi:hypothetical protein
VEKLKTGSPETGIVLLPEIKGNMYEVCKVFSEFVKISISHIAWKKYLA